MQADSHVHVAAARIDELQYIESKKALNGRTHVILVTLDGIDKVGTGHRLSIWR